MEEQNDSANKLKHAREHVAAFPTKPVRVYMSKHKLAGQQWVRVRNELKRGGTDTPREVTKVILCITGEVGADKENRSFRGAIKPTARVRCWFTLRAQLRDVVRSVRQANTTTNTGTYTQRLAHRSWNAAVTGLLPACSVLCGQFLMLFAHAAPS